MTTRDRFAVENIELYIGGAIQWADGLYQNVKHNPDAAIAVINLLAALRAKDGAVAICKAALSKPTKET